MRTFVVAAILAGIPGMVSGQTRGQSPYLACGADVAQQQSISNKDVSAIQNIAVSTCAPFLALNVRNSYAAMERENGPVPAQLEAHTLQKLRERLQSGLLQIIEVNVTALRQQAR